MQVQAEPKRKRVFEDLTPEVRAAQVNRIKRTLEDLEDLEDLPCKMTDALERTWRRVPVDLRGNLIDVVTIAFTIYFGVQSFSGIPIYVSLKETKDMDDDQLKKALYDAHKVAVAMASISFLHNVDDEAMLALLDGPSLSIRAAPDPDEMMLHMTANGIEIGYYGAPEAKFTFTGNSKSLAAMIIQNAPKKARRTIEVEDDVDPPDVILEGRFTITKRTSQGP
jgi:hypothetical protein